MIKRLNQKAITLMEIMVTSVIFSFVAAGIYMTFIIGTRSWAYYNDSVILKQELRRSLFTMAQELREAKDIFITTDEIRGVNITFNKPSSGQVSYTWSNRGENAHRIVRTFRQQTRVLATHISSLSFTQDTTNDITIELSANKQSTSKGQEMHFQMKEKIALRAHTGLMKGAEDL
jgi:type II secretory pathway component PulJ